MASLAALEPVAQLSPYVTRILGQNPGKFTLQGTNSYLVHHPLSSSLLLVDTTGPSSASHLAAPALEQYTSHLLAALANHPAQPARVSDVVLTHWHADHVMAVRGVLEALAARAEGEGEGTASSPPRVWKFPCAAPSGGGGGGAWASEEGKDAEIEQSLVAALRGGWVEPRGDGGEGALRPLEAGQRFLVGPSQGEAGGEEGAGVELEVVHTPGHTSDSICLVLRSSASSSASSSSSPPLALFTADTVLGHGSSIFSSLPAYMSSLSSLSALLPPPPPGSGAGAAAKVPLYPGHGPVCDDAADKVREYRRHREEREAQVVEALRAREAREAVTAGHLATHIYPPSLPPSLHPAATHSLLLHLAKLLDDGRVERVPRTRLGQGDGTARGREDEGEEEGAVGVPAGWDDGWRWVGDEAATAAAAEGDSAGRL